MSGYILSILGIVVVGIIIDVIIPSGSINKYIKSIYSIFVVMILINPIITFINNHKEFKFDYNDYELSSGLLTYIEKQKVTAMQKEIVERLDEEGLKKVEVEIKYSLENDNLILNSCIINLQNVEISADKQHINKYEIITKVVKEITNLSEEVIVIYE